MRVYHFHSWDEIRAMAIAKDVRSRGISKEQFLSDLDTIESVSHKNFWKHRQVRAIHHYLDQVHFYERDNDKDYHFVKKLHDFASWIRKMEKNPTFNKLKRQGILTHEGMYLQFMMTVWLTTFVEVIDMEMKDEPFNTDILVEYFGKKLHVQVKDVNEEIREDKIFDAEMGVAGILLDRCRTNRTEKVLSVTRFTGTPPDGMPKSEILNIARNLTLKPQIVKHKIAAGKYKNKKSVIISFRIRWRPYNDTRTSPTAWYFNNSQKLFQEYDKVTDDFERTPKSNNDIYVFMGLTDDEYKDEDLKEIVNTTGLGLILISKFGSIIQSGKWFLPENFSDVEKKLNLVTPVDKRLKGFD